MAEFPKLADLPDDMTVGQLKRMSEMLLQRQSTKLLADPEAHGPKLSNRRLGFGETLQDAVGDAGDALGFDPRASARVGETVGQAFSPVTFLAGPAWDGVQDIEEGSRLGDPWKRAQGAANIAALPLAAGASPAVAKGVLGATAGGLGLAGLYDTLGPDAAEAAKKKPAPAQNGELTPRQQRRLKEGNLKADADLERENKRLDAEKKRESAARKQKAADDLETQRMREDEERNKPFDKQFPTLSKSLPFAALAAPAALGSVIKGGATALKNSSTRNWNTAIDTAEQALGRKKPTFPAEPQVRLEELRLRNEAYDAAKDTLAGKLDKGTLGAAGAGGFLGMEAGMLPTQYNSWNLPVGNPEGDAADAAMTDPKFYGAQAGRFVAGALGGATGAKAMGALHREAEVPIARSKSLVNTIPKMSKSDIKAAYQTATKEKKDLVAADADKKLIKEKENEILRLQAMMDRVMREVQPVGGKN